MPPAPVKTILFLAANPDATAPLRLGEEMRDIEAGLRLAQQRDQFHLAIRSAVRPGDIQQAMLDTNPAIVHFSGHGTGVEGLVFENDEGKPQFVPTEALASLFELFADQVECVVLNACYSEVQAAAIAQHIPYVIGMSEAIGDQAGINFSVGFYRGLGAGKDIEFAYKLGCNAIALEGIAEDQVPVLRKKAPSRTYIPPDPSATPPAPTSPTVQPAQLTKKRLTWQIVLIVLGLLVLLPSTLMLPQIRILLGIEKPLFRCDPESRLSKKKDLLKVGIADFAKSDGTRLNQLGIEDLLQDKLLEDLDLQRKFAVCRIFQSLTSGVEAREFGKQHGFAVVIWARKNQDFFAGAAEVTGSGSPSTDFSGTFEISNPEFQKNTFPRLAMLLTSMALGDFYYFNNEPYKAREILKLALYNSEIQELSKTSQYANKLARLYFLLGLAFDKPENQRCQRQSDCLDSIRFYERAYLIDKKLYYSLINQAEINRRLGKKEEVIQSYSRLLQNKIPPDIALIAHHNRAAILTEQSLTDPTKRKQAEADFAEVIKIDPILGLQSRADARLYAWKDPEGALSDLRDAIEKNPEDPENYNFLGITELKLGKKEQALKIYQKMICYLDEESKTAIIAGLNDAKEQDRSIAQSITEVITMIQKGDSKSVCENFRK